MLLVFSVIFIILGLSVTVDSVQFLGDNKIPSAYNPFWYFIGVSVWSPTMFVFIAQLMSDISINEHGLRTTFLFKKLVVNWEDIVEIKPSKPFGLRAGRKASIVITRNGLTFFHRIYGIVYGQTNQPAFLIWSNISDYDVLMKDIKKNWRKK